MRQYANTEKSIPEIARELNVETVMEGSVRYAGGQIRITVQLNDGVTGAHLWSETYTRDFDDIFAIESDIALNVANAVGAEFSLAEQEAIEKIPTDSLEAYALYLRAISEDWISPPQIRSRLEPLLLTAIDLDPGFALAYAWLASVYAWVGEVALTVQYAEKALELDPDVGLVYASMAWAYFRTFRFDEALEASEQSIQQSPRDTFTLNRRGALLLAIGREEEAIAVLERSLELDLASSGAYRGVGWARWYSGDREGGVVALRRAVQVAPGAVIAHRALGTMEATLGNTAEGEAQVQLAERLDASPNIITAYSYRVAGSNEDAIRVARAWAESVGEPPPGFASFSYHVVLDEEEQALEALARMIENPGWFGPPFFQLAINAFDDPTLEKPEFRALRAELRAKFGRN